MYEHNTQIRVRYGETDQMGYLYYGHYALYYEVGRTESLRALGISYKSLEDQGIMLPVASLNVEYLRPAFYDDLITVKTAIKEWPEDSFITFHTELYNENNKLLNRAQVKLVFYDMNLKKKCPMPAAIVQALQKYFDK